MQTKIIWRYGRLEKSELVGDNYIFPSYGDKVNHFNEFLLVVDVFNVDGVVYVYLVG